MGPKKPKKLTKKQEQELEEKRKEEAKLEKLRELERKRLEEERNKKIEMKIEKLKEDIIAANEEKELISKEAKEYREEKERIKELLDNHFNSFITYLDWKSYSETEIGYINIRKENEVTEFIHQFKERMEASFYYNFSFKEKNINEEMVYFDFLVKHFKNFLTLYYEALALDSKETKDYCDKYFKLFIKINIDKIDYLTKYFMENFEKLKDMHINPMNYKFLGLQQSVEKTNNGFIDMCIEWPSPEKGLIIGFFCNNENKQREASVVNFRHIPCKVYFLPKQCSIHASILRFIYTKFDENDFVRNEYFPFISVNGMFRVDFISYPPKVISQGKWDVKELITDLKIIELSTPKEGFTQQTKMSVKIYFDQKLHIKDFGDVKDNKVPFYFGTYNRKKSKWQVDTEKPVTLETDELSNETFFNYNDYGDLHSFSLFIDKKQLLPYKYWYLRTVVRQVEVLNYDSNQIEKKTLYIARLDLHTPRINLTLEIEDDYITLVENKKIMKETDELSNLSHLVNKKLKLDELVHELRYSGILIFPSEEDIKYVNFKIKNKESVEKALYSIAMASRSFAIKSHELNKKIDSEIVIVKMKPNPENDDYFFDDEPKDWYELGVYSNKLNFGKAQLVKFKDDLKENELIEEFKDEELDKKIDFLYERPAHDNFPVCIENHREFNKFYSTISDYKIQPGYILNLVSLLRITGITHFP